jgi:hypothetical protein
MEGIQLAVGGGGAGTPARLPPLEHRTSWPELRSETPRGVAARVVRPNDART